MPGVLTSSPVRSSSTSQRPLRDNLRHEFDSALRELIDAAMSYEDLRWHDAPLGQRSDAIMRLHAARARTAELRDRIDRLAA